MPTRRCLTSFLAAVSGVAVTLGVACGGGLVVPTGAATVTAAFGTCDVVNGYAPVPAGYCESVITCVGTYYAICNGTAWSACDCSGAWIQTGTYTKVDKPDFGPAPSVEGGAGDGGAGGDTGGTVGPILMGGDSSVSPPSDGSGIILMNESGPVLGSGDAGG